MTPLYVGEGTSPQRPLPTWSAGAELIFAYSILDGSEWPSAYGSVHGQRDYHPIHPVCLERYRSAVCSSAEAPKRSANQARHTEGPRPGPRESNVCSSDADELRAAVAQAQTWNCRPMQSLPSMATVSFRTGSVAPRTEGSIAVHPRCCHWRCWELGRRQWPSVVSSSIMALHDKCATPASSNSWSERLDWTEHGQGVARSRS